MSTDDAKKQLTASEIESLQAASHERRSRLTARLDSARRRRSDLADELALAIQKTAADSSQLWKADIEAEMQKLDAESLRMTEAFHGLDREAYILSLQIWSAKKQDLLASFDSLAEELAALSAHVGGQMAEFAKQMKRSGEIVSLLQELAQRVAAQKNGCGSHKNSAQQLGILSQADALFELITRLSEKIDALAQCSSLGAFAKNSLDSLRFQLTLEIDSTRPKRK